MPEPVIVALGRSPIGRAMKGSLVNIRPDDLAASVVNQVLDRLPQLDRATIEDLICGCGLPGGEQGFNLGRVISILTRLNAPGTTVTRYCASSLQTTRMAAHAIRAGEGDVFLSVGVECVSRFMNGSSDMSQCQNERLQAGQPGRVSGHLHRDGTDRGERRGTRGDLARGDGPIRAAQPAARGRGAG